VLILSGGQYCSLFNKLPSLSSVVEYVIECCHILWSEYTRVVSVAWLHACVIECSLDTVSDWKTLLSGSSDCLFSGTAMFVHVCCVNFISCLQLNVICVHVCVITLT